MARELKRLDAAARTAVGTSPARRLRAAGRLPAVVYGAGRGPAALELDGAEFEKAVAAGERLLRLTVAGAEPAERQVMIKEVQYEPVSRRVLHVDFQEISAQDRVTVEVKLRTRGVPAGAAEGGVLNLVLHEVEVRCLPLNIPDEIRVNVAGLRIGDVIRAGQLEMPEGAALATGPDTVVVALEAPRTEKDLEVAVTAEGAREPEVLTARKEEEEAAAEAGAAPAAAKPEAAAAKPEAKEKKE